MEVALAPYTPSGWGWDKPGHAEILRRVSSPLAPAEYPQAKSCPIFSAASACIATEVCVYTPKVSTGELCPTILCTTAGGILR